MKYFLILGASVISALLATVTYVYLAGSIGGFLSEIATIQEKIATVDQRDVIAKSQSTFLEETAVDRVTVAGFISRDADIVHVIETIEAAGRREKVLVTIGSVVVEPEPLLKNLERVRVTLSARGTFASLGAFATALEMFPVASRLDDISIEASTNNLWFGTYTLVLVKEKAQ